MLTIYTCDILKDFCFGGQICKIEFFIKESMKMQGEFFPVGEGMPVFATSASATVSNPPIQIFHFTFPRQSTRQ